MRMWMIAISIADQEIDELHSNQSTSTECVSPSSVISARYLGIEIGIDKFPQWERNQRGGSEKCGESNEGRCLSQS